MSNIKYIYLLIYLKKLIPEEFKDNLLLKIISKITFDIFSLTLETYCPNLNYNLFVR